jgi:hypothetical protein
MTDLSQKLEKTLLVQNSGRFSLQEKQTTAHSVPRSEISTRKEGRALEEVIAPEEQEFFVS